MASSSSLSRTWRYNIFTSFHGPDVRETFLSHLRKQFENNAITMFNDEEIRRGEVIAPALTQAIEESRISIVLLSKQYASSSWCLDELLKIIKCRKEIGQEVMTVFYGVEPSDVRKQDGKFGDAFNKTCAKNTEEQREKWRKALTEVGNIAGEDFKNWKNEAKMIEKIASDISDILLDTTPKDFDDMVGLEAHMREMVSRLEFDNNDIVKIVAISGPAGIGKTTIASAIYSRYSKSFHHDCFLDLRKLSDCDEYALREQLLSKVLNLNGIKRCHSDSIPERLHDKKVFIILDDVQSKNQLDVLADIRWYGPGSRIIVTTENEDILQRHGINDIYHVSFPSQGEALKIFCLSAFKKTSPPDGFLNLSKEVVRICSNLPLGLKVVGSSLRGKNLDDWELQLPRLKDSLDGGIESVLQLGYKSLHEKDQLIFLCIAVFFNGEDVDYVTSKLDEPNWNARLGLKNLVSRYILQYVDGRVEMHHLLQLLARQVISNQGSKQQILVDSHEIHNVLEKAIGNKSVVGISFDTRKVEKLLISTEAFDEMFNLLFLKIYDDTCNPTAIIRNMDVFSSGDEYNEYIRKRVLHIRKRVLHIPEEMEFPSRLRLVHWEAYPRKSLPLRFCVKNLVELNMKDSKLKKLWEGTQPLANLRKMILSGSYHLKELPDLSNATNLEVLDLSFCRALVEIPSSIANLHSLRKLVIDYCESLEIIPSLANLTSLKTVININGCSKLRTFPDFSTNLNFLTSIRLLSMKNTGLKELPASLRHYSRLKIVQMSSSGNLRTFSTYLPTSVVVLDLSYSGIESITDCIKGLHNLHRLSLSGCKRLVSLPEPPSSLMNLQADDCESLSRVSVPLNTPNAILQFTNCFKLDPQARQAIIKQSYFPVRGSANSTWGILPGREVPEEFVHKSTRNSLTIPPSSFNRVKGCIVISPKLLQDISTPTSRGKYDRIYFDCKINGNLKRSIKIQYTDTIQAEHLLIFGSNFLSFDPSKVSTTIVLECRVSLGFYPNIKFNACPFWGIQTFTDEKEDDEDDEDDDNDEEV